MNPEILAWMGFGAAVFLLMGLNLGLGAERHARAAASWAAGGGRSEAARGRRLVWAYRAGGAAFAGFGLWLLWGLARDPSGLAALTPRQRLTPLGRTVAGLFFLCLGSVLGALRVSEALRPGPSRTWEADLGGVPEEEPETWAQKAGRAAPWLLALAFLVFGAYLVGRAAVTS